MSMESVKPGVNVDFGSIPVRSQLFPGSNYVSRRSDRSLDRSEEIVEDITKFGQMTSKQIEAIHFGYATEGSASVMCWKALMSLTKSKRISRLEKSRMSGGTKKGSTGYVYVPRTSDAENPNPHKLDIAGLYCELVVASRSGRFVVAEYAPEKHAYVTVGSMVLKPDARLVIERGGVSRRFHIELDKSTEHKPELRKKIGQYLQAWDEWDDGNFPLVVFVVAHERPERIKQALREITTVIGELDAEDQVAFTVTTIDKAVAFLTQH